MYTIDIIDKRKIQPIVEAIGKTRLRQLCKSFDAYEGIRERYDYLISAQSRLQNTAAKSNSYDCPGYTPWDEGLLESLNMTKNHLTTMSKLLSLLDIYNSIDQLADDPTIQAVLKEWNDYKEEFPTYVMDSYLMAEPKPKTFLDEAGKLLVKQTYAARRGEYIQRINNACEVAHANGWFLVFDTLTLSNDRVSDFLESKTAIRDYTRSIGRKVNEALGRKKSDPYTDVYQYICVPEYGSKNGRLHFHCLHFLKELPINTIDPNRHGAVGRKRQKLFTLQGHWGFGFSDPIPVRYNDDAYTKRGWLMPLNDNGAAEKLKPVVAVAAYVSKYIGKQMDEKCADELKRNERKWIRTLKDRNLNHKLYRVRMSRGFGTQMADMSHLQTACLIQLTNLHWTVSKYHVLLKKNARNELKNRLLAYNLNEISQVLPTTDNLLKSLRALMKTTSESNPLNFSDLMKTKLQITDIFEDVSYYIESNGYSHLVRPRFTDGGGPK